jgi:hypothetical protein
LSELRNPFSKRQALSGGFGLQHRRLFIG